MAEKSLVFSHEQVSAHILCSSCKQSLHGARQFFIFRAEKQGTCTGGNTLATVDVCCCHIKQKAPLAFATEQKARAFCAEAMGEPKHA